MSRALLFAFVLVLFAPSRILHGQESAITDAGMDPQRLVIIPRRMKEFVDSGTIAGAVTLVARRGVVVSLEAVGFQDLESKTPMTTSSIFRIMSMTKPVTAVGIMILVEDGRLRLGDPVERYVPEFRAQMVVAKREGDTVLATRKPSRPITIRDLLTHTSGMVGEGATEGTSRTLAEYVANLPQEPLRFDPGTAFSYSDGGFETLGRIIEIVSRQPYERFVEQRILLPLGMKSSSFFPPPEVTHRLVSTGRIRDGKLQTTEKPNPAAKRYAHPSYTMYSTAADMFCFYQMMLNGGTYNGVRILSRRSVEKMTTLQTADSVDLPWGGYGLGWFVFRELRPHDFGLIRAGSFGHGGLLGTHGWVDPKEALVGIFMIQHRSGTSIPDAMRRDIFINLVYAAIVN